MLQLQWIAAGGSACRVTGARRRAAQSREKPAWGVAAAASSRRRLSGTASSAALRSLRASCGSRSRIHRGITTYSDAPKISPDGKCWRSMRPMPVASTADLASAAQRAHGAAAAGHRGNAASVLVPAQPVSRLRRGWEAEKDRRNWRDRPRRSAMSRLGVDGSWSPEGADPFWTARAPIHLPGLRRGRSAGRRGEGGPGTQRDPRRVARQFLPMAARPLHLHRQVQSKQADQSCHRIGSLDRG